MLLSPETIAILSGSTLAAGFTAYAALFGLCVLRRWDLSSGSDGQLRLERKTYLISTLFNYLMILEIASLALWVYTADKLHTRLIGAMCAAGVFNAASSGYPALVIKLVNTILCGLWLVIHHADRQAEDYPLIRPKYRLTLLIAAATFVETLLTLHFFLNLRPNYITSCCGALFSTGAPTLMGDIAAMPALPMMICFFGAFLLILRVGIHAIVTGEGWSIYSIGGALFFWICLASVVSFISVFFYEQPTHHCPFCILQGSYNYVGYPLYGLLLTGVITGIGPGVITRTDHSGALNAIAPRICRRLCLVSLIAFAGFVMIAVYPMIFSDFRLFD